VPADVRALPADVRAADVCDERAANVRPADVRNVPDALRDVRYELHAVHKVRGLHELHAVRDSVRKLHAVYELCAVQQLHSVRRLVAVSA
jgi:hypothetical protein